MFSGARERGHWEQMVIFAICDLYPQIQNVRPKHNISCLNLFGKNMVTKNV